MATATHVAATCSEHDVKTTPSPVAPASPPEYVATSPTKAKNDELDKAVDRLIMAQSEAPVMSKRGRRLKPMMPPPSITVDSLTTTTAEAPKHTNSAQDASKAAAVFQMSTPTSCGAHFIGTPTSKKDFHVTEEIADRIQNRGNATSVNLNEQEWPSELIIQSNGNKSPVVRELLPSSQLSEESTSAMDEKGSHDHVEAPSKTSNKNEEAASEATTEAPLKTSDKNEEAASEATPEAPLKTSDNNEEAASEATPEVPLKTSDNNEEAASEATPEAPLTTSKDQEAAVKASDQSIQPDVSTNEATDSVDPKLSAVTVEQEHTSASIVQEAPSSKGATAPPPQFCPAKVSHHSSDSSTVVATPPPSPAKPPQKSQPVESAPATETIDKRSHDTKKNPKIKLVEDGFNLAWSMEAQGKLKEAEGQFRRSLSICCTLLGEQPPVALKSMSQLKSSTSAALERLRKKI